MADSGVQKNLSKGSTTSNKPGGVFIGICKRITGGVFVSIPNATNNKEILFGPCKVSGLFPFVGQQLLCTFLENRTSDVVILGKLTSSNVLSNTGTPVEPNDATTKQYVDNQIINLQNQINSLNALYAALSTSFISHTNHPQPI